MCASDPLALGAWRAASCAGGLAVIGFDDTPMAQAVGLSSVRQPLAEVAAECIDTVSMLRDDARGTHGTGEPGTGDDGAAATPELIVRDSG